MYANDYLSKEDLLAWWSRAPGGYPRTASTLFIHLISADAYQELPLMAQLIGQIEEDEEEEESDDDDSDDSDSE